IFEAVAVVHIAEASAVNEVRELLGVVLVFLRAVERREARGPDLRQARRRITQILLEHGEAVRFVAELCEEKREAIHAVENAGGLEGLKTGGDECVNRARLGPRKDRRKLRFVEHG